MLGFSQLTEGYPTAMNIITFKLFPEISVIQVYVLYFFVVEIIEENTNFDSMMFYFWCEKISPLQQVVIKICFTLLIFVDTGAEIAQ